ncbi:MAG: hypothetical protein U0X41_00365 [Chitinophagales bacterium]
MNTQIQFEWSVLMDKTLEVCREDELYRNYSVREKMLAFVYTFLQTMNTDEQKFVSLLQQQHVPFFPYRDLQQLKNDFNGFVEELILEGTNSGEIQARPLIANYYKSVLWNAFMAILYFWAKDNSELRENTDVMVEKTVHFTFDLLAPNAIDSGMDLVQHFLKLRK